MRASQTWLTVKRGKGAYPPWPRYLSADKQKTPTKCTVTDTRILYVHDFHQENSIHAVTLQPKSNRQKLSRGLCASGQLRSARTAVSVDTQLLRASRMHATAEYVRCLSGLHALQQVRCHFALRHFKSIQHATRTEKSGGSPSANRAGLIVVNAVHRASQRNIKSSMLIAAALASFIPSPEFVWVNWSVFESCVSYFGDHVMDSLLFVLRITAKCC